MHPLSHVTLAALLVLSAIIVYPQQLAYPPIGTLPTSISSPGANALVMALPAERSMALYEVGTGSLWRIGLGFQVEGVVASGDRSIAYSRIQQRAAVIDLKSRTALKELVMRIEAAWPYREGFVLHDGTRFTVLGPENEVIRSVKIGYAGSPWSGSAFGSYFWFVGEDLTTLYVLNIVSGEVKQVYKHNDKITSVLALSEDRAAISSKGYIGIIGADGTRKDLRLPYSVSELTRLFPAKAGRMVFVDEISKVVGIIGEDLVEYRVVEELTGLITSPAPSKLYVLDPSASKLYLFDLTFEPEIREARFSVAGKSSVRVEAVVVDVDRDIETGYPHVVVDDGRGSRVIVPMRAISGDRYSADVDLSSFNGKLSLRVVVRDEEGHIVESKAYEVTVDEGEIRTATALTVTATANTSPIQGATGVQQFLLLSVELLFFLILMGALALFALRARRTGKGRSRRRKA
jgi:hypothetical protein